MEQHIDVRDTRNKNWLWMRRELIRVHGAELGPYGIAVYAAIASYANRDECAHPSVKSLAEMIGASVRKVRDCVRQLEDLGWIRVLPHTDSSGRQTSNRYYLLACPVERAPAHDAGGTARDTDPGRHDVQGDPARGADEVEPYEVEKKEVSGSDDGRAHAHEADGEGLDFVPDAHKHLLPEIRSVVDELGRGTTDLRAIARRYLAHRRRAAPGDSTIAEHKRTRGKTKTAAAYVIAGLSADHNPVKYASTILKRDFQKPSSHARTTQRSSTGAQITEQRPYGNWGDYAD